MWGAVDLGTRLACQLWSTEALNGTLGVVDGNDARRVMALCAVLMWMCAALMAPGTAQAQDGKDAEGRPTPVVNPGPNPTIPPEAMKPVKTKKKRRKLPKADLEAEAPRPGGEVPNPAEPLIPNLDFNVSGEYRMRSTRIDPLELNGEQVRELVWHEHRGRLDLDLERKGVLRFNMQMDLIDGVLFGDNGRFGQDPSSNSGVSVAIKRPNRTVLDIGLPEGGDPLDRESYRPSLGTASDLEINYLYADVILPVGLLRVGRQPQAEGDNLAAHSGGRFNRWGVSQFNDTSDRVLFGTKLDEAVNFALEGPGYKPNLSLDKGVFLGVAYDINTQNNVAGLNGDLRQVNVALQWRHPEASWFGSNWKDIFFSAIAVRLDDEDFDTKIWGFPLRGQFVVGDFSFLSQFMFIRGETREISEGFAALSNNDPTVQELNAEGAQIRADYVLGPVMLTMEFDYATGDADPRSNTPITSYSFARDMNIGLLLFERVLAFESARSVAVGVENLTSLNADSFPLTEVQTDGRFTNAIALFPQVKLNLADSPKNKLHLRLGVLMAWPEAGGVVDPVLTTLSLDGDEVTDDVVNFHGGDPGGYYGTEYDVQLQWTWKESFIWTVEGAYLDPGSSLQDENGDAVPSLLLENRFEYIF